MVVDKGKQEDAKYYFNLAVRGYQIVFISETPCSVKEKEVEKAKPSSAKRMGKKHI